MEVSELLGWWWYVELQYTTLTFTVGRFELLFRVFHLGIFLSAFPPIPSSPSFPSLLQAYKPPVVLPMFNRFQTSARQLHVDCGFGLGEEGGGKHERHKATGLST